MNTKIRKSLKIHQNGPETVKAYTCMTWSIRIRIRNRQNVHDYIEYTYTKNRRKIVVLLVVVYTCSVHIRIVQVECIYNVYSAYATTTTTSYY